MRASDHYRAIKLPAGLDLDALAKGPDAKRVMRVARAVLWAQRAQQALEMLGLADGQPGSLFRRHTQGVEEQLAREVLRLRKVYTLYASSVLAAILVVQRTLIAARDGLSPRITELEQRLTDATLKIRELEDGTRAAAYDAVVDASEELLLLLGARDGGIEDGTPIDAAAHALRNALDHGIAAPESGAFVDRNPEARAARAKGPPATFEIEQREDGSTALNVEQWLELLTARCAGTLLRSEQIQVFSRGREMSSILDRLASAIDSAIANAHTFEHVNDELARALTKNREVATLVRNILCTSGLPPAILARHVVDLMKAIGE